MFQELWSAVRVAGATILICAVAYPIAILAVAMAIAPDARLGSLVVNGSGQVIGSRLIAQSFTRPEYFWPRPSACDFDASAAAGSNLSPANPAIAQRAETILANLHLGEGELAPADLVTASGGGLDPHISDAAASIQAPRVAKARGISENAVKAVIDQHAEQIPLTGGKSSRIVNVLQLNLALDDLKAVDALND